MARDYAFLTLDVFTSQPFGGNPLGVFPKADGLDTPTMQAIAAELNLSETVFITSPDDGSPPRLRIFTPKTELPFAGHPTVGAATVIADRTGRIGKGEFSIETTAGQARAEVQRREDGLLEASVIAPRLPASGPAPGSDEAAAVLGLNEDQIIAPPIAFEAGVPITFVRLASREALSKARIDTAIWNEVFRNAWAPQVYPFFMADWQNGREIHARLFAPGVGIPEDPATGAAAVALAGVLHELQRPADRTVSWLIRQGEDMGRPSRIALSATEEDGRLVSVSIGGPVVPMTRGTLSLS